MGGAGLCLIEDVPDLFLCTSRSGSRTAEPSGGSGKSAGAEAASWPSMDSTGPWCATPFPCQSPSSSPPRTASWTPVPRGCWVRARTLPGVLPLGRGERAPEEGQSPEAGMPGGHNSLAGERPSEAGLPVSLGGGSEGRLHPVLGVCPSVPRTLILRVLLLCEEGMAIAPGDVSSYSLARAGAVVNEAAPLGGLGAPRSL